MELIAYYLLCLFARKKIIVNLSYFIGTIAFISLSYNTANKLSKVPLGNHVSFVDSSINQSQISNISFQHEERIEYLRNQCGYRHDPSLLTLQNVIRFDRSDLFNHLGFVVRSHPLFYCSVPKVATRTLLPYITYLHIRDDLINSSSNKFNTDYLNQILSTTITNNSSSLLPLFLSRLMISMKPNSTQFDLWSMYQKNTLPFIRLRTLSNPLSLFSNSSIRVIFVRHPLERLASAYVDKIGTLSSESLSLYDTLHRSICRKYLSFYLTNIQQENNQMNEACKTIIPSFEHFVEYIMSDSSQVDVHWKPYSSLCHVCTFKYNFIGKYETIQDDLNFFKQKIGLISNDWNINNHFSNKKTKEDYKLMYSKLSNELICNLKDFYNDDLRLFNYRFEDYLGYNQTRRCGFRRYFRF